MGVKLQLVAVCCRLLVLLLTVTRSCSLWTGFDEVEKAAGAGAGDGEVAVVQVETGSILATTDGAYVCATLDWYPSDRCSYGSCSWDQAGILTLNLNQPLLEKSLQALSPLRLRLGGTVQDEIVYNIGLSDPATQCLPIEKDDVNITGYRGGCLTMERWTAMNDLFAKTGVRVVFGLNALYNRPKLDSGGWGPWDPSNARDLIRFSAQHGIQVEGWELGNELTANHVVTTLPADQYGKDLKVLRNVVDSASQEFATPRAMVMGPAGTGGVGGPEWDWYNTFLTESGPGVVDAVTRHIYNLGPGNADNLVERILDPSVLDNDRYNFETVQKIIQTTAPWATAWVGEAGGAYNSGKHLVSNAFVMSFWYLDQLAQAATYNTKAYCRQTLIGGNYGLLNSTTFRPNPDLYSAILFKRLMGRQVLKTSVRAGNPLLRAYTHCQAGSTTGGVVMLLLNLSPSNASNVAVDVKASMPTTTYTTSSIGKGSKQHLIGHKFKGGAQATRQEYHLTAQNGDLHSQTSLLNGVPLEVRDGGELPSLDIPLVRENSLPVVVAPLSIVFVVLPDAQLPICLKPL